LPGRRLSSRTIHWCTTAAGSNEVERSQLEEHGMLATSDSRWILLDRGIPVVNFSMGNDSGHNPHE
jgi:hypothetical protein